MMHDPESVSGPGDPDPDPGRHPEHAHERGAKELSPEEEPTTTGTLFIMILFLMALGGLWTIMYLTLLSR